MIGQLPDVGDMLERNQFGTRVHVAARMAQDFHQFPRELGMAREQ